MNWSLTGVLKALPSLLSGTKKIQDWNETGFPKRLQHLGPSECVFHDSGWTFNGAMKSVPKAQGRDPWVLCPSLILHHTCRKPVSARPATLLQTFSKEERCETTIPLSASQHSEPWFLLLFVTSQQQFILSYILSEAGSEVDVYFERWSSQNTCIMKACFLWNSNAIWPWLKFSH